MKRIIGIPFRKKSKGEKGEKEEREPPPPKPQPPGLIEMTKKADDKAEEIEKKVKQCDEELRKVYAHYATLPAGTTKDGMKAKAMAILKRKKVFEHQVESLRQQSFNIEQTSTALQSTKDAVTVMKVIKKGVKELKKEQKKIDLEDVEELNDELGDLFQQSEDVQDVLGRDLNMPVIDDAELEEQLELLGQDFVADTDSSYLDEALKKPTGVGTSSFKDNSGLGLISGRTITHSAKKNSFSLPNDGTSEIPELPSSNPLDINDILFDVEPKSG